MKKISPVEMPLKEKQKQNNQLKYREAYWKKVDKTRPEFKKKLELEWINMRLEEVQNNSWKYHLKLRGVPEKLERGNLITFGGTKLHKCLGQKKWGNYQTKSSNEIGTS